MKRGKAGNIMAFDWTNVEGYSDDLTPEEKLALLEGYEAPKPDYTGYIAKKQFDEVSSKLADAKKQLRSRQTEDEQREEERKAAQEQMENELKELRREKTLNSHKASFLAQGFDEDTAKQAAEALADGDTDTVFTMMGKQRAALEKSLRAQILKETPVPPAGEPSGDAPEDDPFLKGFDSAN